MSSSRFEGAGEGGAFETSGVVGEPVRTARGGEPAIGTPMVGDRDVGAFSATPPWLVRPEAMPWRSGIDALRVRQRDRVPAMIRRRPLPPLRLFRVAVTIGWAVALWWVKGRAHGRRGTRAELAHRLRSAFESLGATYVKLGQVIASADGMLPAELVSEFKRCRDQVTPGPFSDVRAVLEGELGMPLARCFAEFDERPLAAASIAQVHTARLISGEEVVVKIQRPGLDRVVERDLAAMSWLIPILGKRLRLALLANMPAYLELFAETIIEELDFRLEAQNMLDVAALLAKTAERPVVVPRPHPELVTRRVLVMEPLRGFKIDDDRAMLDAGIDPTPVFRSLLVSFFEGALVYGVFHGDLHGGNMMVTVDGRLGIFDFGITGRLSAPARAALLQLLIGGTTNDVQLQLRAFTDLGGFPPGTDLRRVSEELRLEERAVSAPAQLSPEELANEVRELVARLVDHGARLPKDLFLFVKGMIYLNGAIAALAADVDVFSELLALFEHFATRHGAQLSAETGVAVNEIPFDREHLRQQTKAQVGLDVDRLTYRELREHQAGGSPAPPVVPGVSDT